MTINQMHPSWRRFKRKSKLTPAFVQSIYTVYMKELADRGITTTDQLQVVRSEIVRVLGDRFNLGYSHIYKILRRESWTEQTIPDDWIPFI